MAETRRVFLLSPASTSGKRAQLLFNPGAAFDLALRIRQPEGVPLGDAFAFLSGLYFRGKLQYAGAFARSGDVVRVITSDRGLVAPAQHVSLDDLRAMSRGSIDHTHRPYRDPLERHARELRTAMGDEGVAILLGSIATEKYVGVLREVFGARLVFPAEFVGRGDMSRGGLMLRCVSERRELDYTPVITAVRRGSRPPKLPPP